MQSINGRLIVIEGIDGAGKSTLAQSLVKKLTPNTHEVVLTKEPGGSQLGKKLRTLLQTKPVEINPIAEYLLFAADRAQHCAEIITPALARGATVISDRMNDSSVVYQGYGRGIDRQHIHEINTWAMQGITPDIILYLKIDTKTAIARMKKRGTLTAFEKEYVTYIGQLIHGFNNIYANRTNVITLNAALPPDILSAEAHIQVEAWQP